jgi:hypothetical protein
MERRRKKRKKDKIRKNEKRELEKSVMYCFRQGKMEANLL